MTVEDIKTIIKRHITTYDQCIAERDTQIKESYSRGQTNVDAARDAIVRFEQRKLALTILVSEIETSK